MAIVEDSSEDSSEDSFEDSSEDSFEDNNPAFDIALVQGPSKEYIQSMESWQVDTACTRHMGCNKEHFEELRPLDQPTWVTVGNGQKIEAQAIGTVFLLSEQRKGFRSTKNKLTHPP